MHTIAYNINNNISPFRFTTNCNTTKLVVFNCSLCYSVHRQIGVIKNVRPPMFA